MADTIEPGTTAPKKTTRKKAKPAASKVVAETAATANREEAKSRFSNAVNEAKAGAAALKAEAGERGVAYRDEAKIKAGEYGDQAKKKAGELAVEGKAKASEGLNSLSRLIDDNVGTLDEKLGAKYGDYARSASRSLSETATKLDDKSVEELGEDAREFVRQSPGLAVGLAAFAGFLIARTLGGRR